ncbi:MAG: tail protein X [Sulfitobacter sp.]
MPAKMPHFTHLTIDGDRWDLLAYRYYGDANKQTVLLDANRRLFISPVVVPPLILSSGITLIIPVLEDDQVADIDLPPWKRSEASYE